jgi:hypothetical protein
VLARSRGIATGPCQHCVTTPQPSGKAGRQVLQAAEQGCALLRPPITSSFFRLWSYLMWQPSAPLSLHTQGQGSGSSPCSS